MAVKDKNKKGKTPRQKRQKPAFLPGMEPVSIPALDEAADSAYEATRNRQALAEEERIARANLLALMKEHKQTRYETADGLIVVVLSDEKVKCSKAKQEVALNGDE